MSEGSYKAFEAANGWYVAWEFPDGVHYQPAGGPWLYREEAEGIAADLQRAEGKGDTHHGS